MKKPVNLLTFGLLFHLMPSATLAKDGLVPIDFNYGAKINFLRNYSYYTHVEYLNFEFSAKSVNFNSNTFLFPETKIVNSTNHCQQDPRFAHFHYPMVIENMFDLVNNPQESMNYSKNITNFHTTNLFYEKEDLGIYTMEPFTEIDPKICPDTIIEKAFKFCKLGQLTQYIVTKSAFTRKYRQMINGLKPYGLKMVIPETLVMIFFTEDFSKCGINKKGDKFVISVPIPMIETSAPKKLVGRIVSIPFNAGISGSCRMQLETEYFIISASEETLFLLKGINSISCLGTSNFCIAPTVMQKQHQDFFCISDMFFGNTKYPSCNYVCENNRKTEVIKQTDGIVYVFNIGKAEIQDKSGKTVEKIISDPKIGTLKISVPCGMRLVAERLPEPIFSNEMICSEIESVQMVVVPIYLTKDFGVGHGNLNNLDDLYEAAEGNCMLSSCENKQKNLQSELELVGGPETETVAYSEFNFSGIIIVICVLLYLRKLR